MTRPCILHVDDDDNIRALAALAFDLDGRADVLSAASGAEALRLVEQGARPDLLLLDVMMPEMDGPALLAALRRLPACARLPAVFMTAQTQDRETARLRALGAAGLVTKPFDPLRLAPEVLALAGPTA